MIDRRPELIVRPLDLDDVSAVRFAAEADLPIAVRGRRLDSVEPHRLATGDMEQLWNVMKKGLLAGDTLR